MISPGSTTGFRALASSLMFSTCTPRSCATLFRLKSLVTIFPLSVRASSISFRSTSRTSGKSASEMITSAPVIFCIFCRMSRPRRPRLRFIESAESATSCSSFSTNCGITRVPSMKPVSQRSAMRPSMITRGIENLVAPLRAGGAEQAHQARRLQPLALPAADARARGTATAAGRSCGGTPPGRHRGPPRTGPRRCPWRGPGRRPANQGPRHVRHRRLAQQPFEDDREQGKAEAEEQVGDERRPQWP